MHLAVEITVRIKVKSTNSQPIMLSPNPRPCNFLNREISEIREESRPFPQKQIWVRLFRVFRGFLSQEPDSNPERVAFQRLMKEIQLFQSCDFPVISPWVARSAQPRADRFNPFGIDDNSLAPAGGAGVGILCAFSWGRYAARRRQFIFSQWGCV